MRAQRDGHKKTQAVRLLSGHAHKKHSRMLVDETFTVLDELE